MSIKLFDRLQSSTPGADNPFIKLLDGSVITYGDLMRRSGKGARLLEQLGVAIGDRVAVQTEKSVEALVFYVAC
ncbi:MAG TPA: AMP-binding protein, partial [Hyphomicrobiales bacterium]|nr:AMP-binding protein [Hyphomicrobiales bacterium]